MMLMSDFLVVVYCLVSDLFTALVGDQRLRRRGPMPALTDSEVITMEVVGEFLGHDTDKGIWEYFRRHWHAWFPRLGSRAQFARQASDLWRIKQLIQQALARILGAFDDDVHTVDGHPMKVCVLSRAARCKRFRGVATKGYCASKKEFYYGLHGHLLMTMEGIVTSYTITGANADEREAAWDLLEGITGRLLGDKGYISAFFKSLLREREIQLDTPVRKNMIDDCPREVRQVMLGVRRRIERILSETRVWRRDAGAIAS